jgi:hypothetical protein
MALASKVEDSMRTPNTGRDVNTIPTRDMALTVGITTLFTDALSRGITAALATSPADDKYESMEGHDKDISFPKDQDHEKYNNFRSTHFIPTIH